MMPPEPISLCMREWETCDPTPDSLCWGRALDPDPFVRQTAERLTRAGRLEILEFTAGLRVRTFQYVGVLRLGSIEVVIRPKLDGLPLLNLLRYAYHLHCLDLLAPLDIGVDSTYFHDIIILQLLGEARELIEYGLYRHYERVEDKLASPRGRIDIQALARGVGLPVAALPCVHYQRLEDNLLNQVLLSGLRLAIQLTGDLILRAQERRLAGILELSVTSIPLTAVTLARAVNLTSRLTATYRPALKLIEILLAAHGISLDYQETTARMPGFLFDMNRFFQALLTRFLSENLPGYLVRGEYQLYGMMSYDPMHNPHHRRSPTPRPDLAILQGGKVLALLDAKYRDLWREDLPRDMLYQLALYAFSQGKGSLATILYPTLSSEAREAHIEITEPISRNALGRVILRPVNMFVLEKLITVPLTVSIQRDRETFAHQLAFGD